MKIYFLTILGAILFLTIITVVDDLVPEINRIELNLVNQDASQGQLRIALVSDLHIANNQDSLSKITSLWKELVAEAPDIIMLAGDYVSHVEAGNDLTLHRRAIASVSVELSIAFSISVALARIALRHVSILAGTSVP